MNEIIIPGKLQKSNSKNKSKYKRIITVPVSITLQEAEDLNKWCMNDKDLLISAGLEKEYIEVLPYRIKDLRISQAKWNTDFNYYKVCQSEWAAKVREGFSMRRELLHHYYYAFNFNKEAYFNLKKINMKNSTAVMIKNLIELSELGQKYSANLMVIGMEMDLIEKARIKSFEFASQFAKVTTSLKETNSKRELRDNAYINLKKTVNEIRKVGQFTFWKNENKKKGYISHYVWSKKQKLANHSLA